MQAEGLSGNERVTHPFVRIRIGEQSQLTSVQWQNLNPRWDEALNFRCGTPQKLICYIKVHHFPSVTPPMPPKILPNI